MSICIDYSHKSDPGNSVAQCALYWITTNKSTWCLGPFANSLRRSRSVFRALPCCHFAALIEQINRRATLVSIAVPVWSSVENGPKFNLTHLPANNCAKAVKCVPRTATTYKLTNTNVIVSACFSVQSVWRYVACRFPDRVIDSKCSLSGSIQFPFLSSQTKPILGRRGEAFKAIVKQMSWPGEMLGKANTAPPPLLPSIDHAWCD